ncbi:tetratricopeptide repeat protein [Candidatus Jidaibacter acanthamoebae]|nr:tetratricopeptide repeat protein [Candidatus Jidaibacter acanthamoeba]
MRSGLHNTNIAFRRVATNVDVPERLLAHRDISSLLRSLGGSVAQQVKRISLIGIDNTTVLFSREFYLNTRLVTGRTNSFVYNKSGGMEEVFPGKSKTKLYYESKRDLKRNFCTNTEPKNRSALKEKLVGNVRTILSSAVGGVVGGLIGYNADTLLPSSFILNRQKKLRRLLGTERLELEVKNILPPIRDYTDFIERKQAITNLEKGFLILEKDYKIQEILITGEQGSGKTELAEEYANKYAEKIGEALPDNTKTIKIFKVESKDDFQREFREFARELGVQIEDNNDEDIISEVHKKLIDRPYWLIIFDNLGNSIDSQELDYQFIEKYIPKGEWHKGRVIITSRDHEIIPENKRYIIKIVDTTSSEYRFLKEEVIQLIDKVIGEGHKDYGSRYGWKEKLGASLGYLPHAINKAAAYIRYKEGENIISYIENIRKELGLKEGEYPDVRDNDKKIKYYEKINNVVNNLSKAEISKNTIALDILKFVELLNPDSIQTELLKIRFKEVKEDKFIEALELLKDYKLLEEKGNNQWKLHRSMVPSIDVIKTEKKEQLNKIIEFFKNNFKRDNTGQQAKNKNALFVPHVVTLLFYQDKVFGKSKSAEYVYFKVALASHYMMTGRSIKAREILETSKEFLEKLAEEGLNDSDKDKLKEFKEHLSKLKWCILDFIKIQEEKRILNEQINIICNGLKNEDEKLLTIYSQTLYHLGRTYFDIGGESDIYRYYLQQAVAVREVIDRKIGGNGNIAENQFNENGMDSILVQRNGILEFKHKTENNNNLEDIITEYNKLEKKIVDVKNKWSCRSEKFRIRQKIAAGKKSYQEKKRECDRAVQEMYKDEDYIDKGEGDFITSEDVFSYLTEGDRKSDTRQAKYLNDMGKLLYITGEYKEALKFYNKSIDIEQEKKSISLELGEAYLGVAKAYVAYKDKKDITQEQEIIINSDFAKADAYKKEEILLDIANSAIKRCFRIQDEIGISKNHEQRREAIELSNIILDSNYISKVERQAQRNDMYII